jgi:hypothetical protein
LFIAKADYSLDVYPVLPTYKNHNVTRLTVYSVRTTTDSLRIPA